MAAKFAVVVNSKQVKAYDGSILTEEGARKLAIIEQDGWVEATSSGFTGTIRADAKLFSTEKEAVDFAKRWEGHPWYCQPNGEYEIIEVVPEYKTIQQLIGYARKGAPSQ